MFVPSSNGILVGWDGMQQHRKEGGVFLHAPVGGKYMVCLSVRLPVTEGGREGRSLLWTGPWTAVPMQQMPAILHVFSDF